jgi:putative Mg2+ transporter-C (MgtC) family protein
VADRILFESWDQLTLIAPPFLIRCGAAALCGAIIGLERQLKGKPAGFRTNILICLGSAMYMAVGLLVLFEDKVSSDPTRIAAQVVTGIGFLGAGCIIQERGRITGLTTAASIWVVAAIGIVAGAGFPILAFIASAIVVTTLAVLGIVEDRFLAPYADDYPDNGGGEDRKDKRQR